MGCPHPLCHTHLQQTFFSQVFIFHQPLPLQPQMDTKPQKMMKRGVGPCDRAELSRRAVMIFHVVCKYTHKEHL